MRCMRHAFGPLRVGLALWLCTLAYAAGAETVYVGDRFEIGVHDGTKIDSVILAVIPSGTALTVIGRNGDFVEVSTPDGTAGWVDARYVVNEKPSVALLEERDARLKDAVRSLGDARAEVEVLRQRVSELQRDATTAAHKSSDIAKPVSLAPNEETAKLAKANLELENKSEEILKLNTRVAELQALQSALETSASESAGEQSDAPRMHAPAGADMGLWTPWQWLMFGSILLLAFAAGGYAVDWEFRRRHGGFRV